MMKNKGCKKKGCTDTHYAWGRCRYHYTQMPDVKKRRAIYAANYYLENRDRRISVAKRYYKDNKKQIQAVTAKWYQENKKRLNKKAKERYHRIKKEGIAV